MYVGIWSALTGTVKFVLTPLKEAIKPTTDRLETEGVKLVVIVIGLD